MYSYEDRKKAVELYKKFDKSASAVVRELGYPTTRMLTLWYREYLENGDLHKKSRMQSGYTAEQKAVAVKYYQEHGRGLALLLESKMLDDESRGEWLRKQGLHSEHLPLWEQELAGMVQDKQSALKSENANLKKEKKQLEKDLKAKERELAVKEKALADAAVLLLLKKKHQNLFREDEES